MSLVSVSVGQIHGNYFLVKMGTTGNRIVVQLETSDQKLLLQWQGEEMWGAETKPEDDHKVIVRELRLAVMTIRKL